MTEPAGGTDVLRAMTTKASPADGGYMLRGTKIWSTTAHVVDRIMVTARTREAPSRRSSSSGPGLC